MPDLREQLRQCFQGRVCLMGLGNVDYGDDGLGVRLAEALAITISPSQEANPKGIPSLSPGLRGASYPGCGQRKEPPTLKGLQHLTETIVARQKPAPCCNPFRVEHGLGPQPWAGGYNPFGIEKWRADFGIMASASGEGKGEGRWALKLGPSYKVLIAGTTPERCLSGIADEGFDQVIFLDAVQFGGAPGSTVLLNSDEMAARFPQVSTHKLSLGLLARQIEANGRSKAWLLGVQPESLKHSERLSPTVQATIDLLLELLRTISTRNSRGSEARTSLASQLDKRRDLSLVTSAVTRTTEVTA